MHGTVDYMYSIACSYIVRAFPFEQSDSQAGADAAASIQPKVQQPTSSGRASHRGGAGGKGEPRPGGVEEVTSGMGHMSMGGGGEQAGLRGRRRGGIVVDEPVTRPSHIVDKKGGCISQMFATVNLWPALYGRHTFVL